MDKEKSYYHNIVMILVVSVALISFVMSTHLVEIGNLLACAHVLIYPITYFLMTLYLEKYNETKSINLVVYTVIAIILSAILLITTNAFPSHENANVLVFSLNFRALFGFVLAYVVGQCINIRIYSSMQGRKDFAFLVSSVIAITIDSLLFTFLSFTGDVETSALFRLTAGQYIASVICLIFYAIGFAYLVKSVKKDEVVVSSEQKAPKVTRKKTTSSTSKTTKTKKTTTRSKKEE